MCSSEDGPRSTGPPVSGDLWERLHHTARRDVDVGVGGQTHQSEP